MWVFLLPEWCRSLIQSGEVMKDRSIRNSTGMKVCGLEPSHSKLIQIVHVYPFSIKFLIGLELYWVDGFHLDNKTTTYSYTLHNFHYLVSHSIWYIQAPVLNVLSITLIFTVACNRFCIIILFQRYINWGVGHNKIIPSIYARGIITILICNQLQQMVTALPKPFHSVLSFWELLGSGWV